MNKPLLYLVPVYIGSLKYYTKLVPYLSPHYEVKFLFLRPRDAKLRQMEVYLRERGHVYRLLEEGLGTVLGVSIPLITPALKHLTHLRACRRFFREEHPEVLVVTKNIPPHDILVKEANRLNIDTVMLQWAYGGNAGVSKLNVKRTPLFERYYYRLVDAFCRVLDLLWGGASYVHASPLPNRVGIMDDSAIEVFHDRCGIPAERMQVVGMADGQLIHELNERLRQDPSAKEGLEQKYGLVPGKKIILILVWGLHRRTRWQWSTKEHLAYFRNIVEEVRNIFPPEETQVILKLHPSDDPALYRSLKDLSVRILGDESETDELLCLSYLSIVDPWTAAVALVTAGGISAIFVNFSRLRALNAGKELYHLKEIATTRERFAELLAQSKAGNLPVMFDKRHTQTNAIQKIVELIRTPLRK